MAADAGPEWLAVLFRLVGLRDRQERPRTAAVHQAGEFGRVDAGERYSNLKRGPKTDGDAVVGIGRIKDFMDLVLYTMRPGMALDRRFALGE